MLMLMQRSLSSPDGAICDHPFFSQMSAEHLRLLRDLSMPVQFKKDEIIFRENEPANRFYLINDGLVSLEATVSGKGTIVVDEIGAGDVLGWSWIFEPYLWHFDARATTPVNAWFIYGTRLREECEKDPTLGYAIMTRVSAVVLHRLQATRRRLVYLAGLSTDFAEGTSHVRI